MEDSIIHDDDEVVAFTIKVYKYQYDWLKDNNYNMSKFFRYLVDVEIMKNKNDRRLKKDTLITADDVLE